MPDATASIPERRAAIARWRRELDQLRARYGSDVIPELAEIDRLDASARFKQRAIARLRGQVAELENEIRVLEQEVTGREAGLAALLPDLIARFRRRFVEAWSPTPIPGYRYWDIGPQGGLHGFRQQWTAPLLDAECALDDRDEVPHTNGICGRLGCGIYAVKHLRDLGVTRLDGIVVGLVTLSGKVVEHTLGYRAARAEVVAVGILRRKRLLVTDDPAAIAALFARGPRAVEDACDEAVGAPIPFLTTYFDQRARSAAWTSGSSNA